MASVRTRPLVVLVAALMLAACTKTPTLQQPNQVAQTSPAPPPAPPATVALTPDKGAAGVPASTEIGVKVTDGTVESVTLTDDAGNALTGFFREDKSHWVPDQALKYSTHYTATVTAASADGKKTTQTTDFTTMAKPGKRLGTGLYLFADKTYGVAMPVVVEFESSVPESARATIQSRLFVKTTPHQPGAWSWTGSKQVMYRAKEYWQPGTKIEVRVALEGHPIGDGRHGDMDRRGVGNISKDRIELIVENETKHMTVKKNGETIKSIPVSLGRDSMPSSSGTTVIMDKLAHTVFDTMDDPNPNNRYRVDIDYAQRLTWGGEFIHAAPWSVKDQGVRNVSHGCINVSMENARFLFELTRIGDPVTVRGTGRPLAPGNGFTAWDKDWDDWVKGSALPVA
ncbi:Ig-like domain-containing protein [Allorhizocola rhizosphaerae]|uniref:L,D-transpeptidase n=1 Tax=Allorhizocola rhizosphaerae TaxID=1872709 RepID=UPI003CCC67A6